MIDFFVRPWEILNSGKPTDQTVLISGKIKTFAEARQSLYENVLDESMFISRASEGSVSLEWIMEQPVSIRKKYFEQFQKEVKERQDKLNNKKSTHK